MGRVPRGAAFAPWKTPDGGKKLQAPPPAAAAAASAVSRQAGSVVFFGGKRAAVLGAPKAKPEPEPAPAAAAAAAPKKRPAKFSGQSATDRILGGEGVFDADRYRHWTCAEALELDFDVSRAFRAEDKERKRAHETLRRAEAEALRRKSPAVLNKAMSTFGAEKRLQFALRALKTLEAHMAPTVYTLSGIVNACVRCGDVDTAAAFVRDSPKNWAVEANEVVLTALMKGLCGSGLQKRANALLFKMKEAHNVDPNDRMIATLLRGCMRNTDGRSVKVVLAKVRELHLGIHHSAAAVEYAVKALSTDGYLEDAAEYLVEGPEKAAANQAACLALGTACAMYGNNELASAALAAAKVRKVVEEEQASKSLFDAYSTAPEYGEYPDAWGAPGGKREASAAMFNRLRGRELDAERERLENVLLGVTVLSQPPAKLDGGDHPLTTAAAGKNPASPKYDTEQQLENVLLGATAKSDGGEPAAKRRRRPEDPRPAAAQGVSTGVNARPASFKDDAGVVFIEPEEESSAGPGKIDLGYFEDKTLPLRVEVCSGHGEWVVERAQQERGVANWIGVEIRPDRVYSAWTRRKLLGAASEPRKNLLLVCADAREALGCLKGCGVQDLFINYPEPPGWLSGPSNLLDDDFFKRAHACLAVGGAATMVSDHALYTAHTALRLVRLARQGLFFSTLPPGSGVPMSTAVPSSYGSSYFDRMWLNGKRSKRYCCQFVRPNASIAEKLVALAAETEDDLTRVIDELYDDPEDDDAEQERPLRKRVVYVDPLAPQSSDTS
ncbi:tRNA (guanine-N(7)-)-methyltransferase [Diplonema papillatum]|nr:tRNA (guanine-N(7)-)-methyltransferase [Diplonema papillatum]